MATGCALWSGRRSCVPKYTRMAIPVRVLTMPPTAASLMLSGVRLVDRAAGACDWSAAESTGRVGSRPVLSGGGSGPTLESGIARLPPTAEAGSGTT